MREMRTFWVDADVAGVPERIIGGNRAFSHAILIGKPNHTTNNTSDVVIHHVDDPATAIMTVKPGLPLSWVGIPEERANFNDYTFTSATAGDGLGITYTNRGYRQVFMGIDERVERACKRYLEFKVRESLDDCQITFGQDTREKEKDNITCYCVEAVGSQRIPGLFECRMQVIVTTDKGEAPSTQSTAHDDRRRVHGQRSTLAFNAFANLYDGDDFEAAISAVMEALYVHQGYANHPRERLITRTVTDQGFVSTLEFLLLCGGDDLLDGNKPEGIGIWRIEEDFIIS